MKLMKLQTSAIVLIILTFAACNKPVQQAEWTVTTRNSAWSNNMLTVVGYTEGDVVDVEVFPEETHQVVDGFGACFNELGWTSLSLLPEADRDSIMKELFAPGKGANFTISRMPIGANDFSLEWYSYDETKSDFKLENFSIANDENTLIPFIHKAKEYNPELKVWASPWCPPTWMKHNKHYACRPDNRVNDLAGDPATDLEGTNMFIQEDRYMEAYARYFGKFIDAYRGKGIDVFMVAPQNEPNSCQNFPSCTWTSEGLARFTGDFLIPEMKKRDVAVMLGTMERPNRLLIDSILNYKPCGEYISAVGFQWAGKGAIPDVHPSYPHLKMYQTEQECGDGQNDWIGAVYAWNLMYHYLTNGCNVYDYWNISLEKGGISRWGWAQNSLVVVDPASKTYEYSHEYYVMKHHSHYILPGAKRLETTQRDNLMAFLNTDGSIVVVAGNFNDKEEVINLKIDKKLIEAIIPAQSFNTIVLR